MRIAVSSSGTTRTDSIDQRFGRAPGFVVVDTESDTEEYVPNTQNLEAPQGAGIQAAKLVIDRGVSVVISGHCGPKAYRTLSTAGVTIVSGVTGTVAEAVNAYMAGDLKPSSSANVEEHWM